jgi:ABC-2 type transport system permease protein
MAAVTGAAVILGFRPTAGPAQWIEATAFLTLFVFAITWLSVGLAGLLLDFLVQESYCTSTPLL